MWWLQRNSKSEMVAPRTTGSRGRFVEPASHSVARKRSNVVASKKAHRYGRRRATWERVPYPVGRRRAQPEVRLNSSPRPAPGLNGNRNRIGWRKLQELSLAPELKAT